ncbi:helix-turn-helix domain-containing protein [uncultured Arcticibacterium sp.]|uniref:helix-turn-helix domain-containing protein n=1 Tax=uncultured Arcticibacterium sp. TaxID=2173042 RepID=UPI0030FBC517
MIQFNFNVKDPFTFWENILQYHELSPTINKFDLSEKLGSGSYSFKIIDQNINYLQFNIKLNQPIKFNFCQTESAKNYKLLLFHKGSPKAVKFLNINTQESFTSDTTAIPSFEKDNTTISCHLLSQFSDMPSFIIKENEACTFHLLFLNQNALDEMLPNNTRLNFHEPLYKKGKSSEIIALNKVLSFDKLFETLNLFHDQLHGNKFEKFGDFLKMLGDYFFVIKFLKDSPKTTTSALDDKDFKKLIQIEKKLTQNLTSNPPSLKSLAEEFGISKTKMCVDFKAFYGKGILCYYNDLKLKLAKELLVNTSHSMKEISNQLSFSNQSNCNKWFKKNAGTTPKSFRKGEIKHRQLK